MKSKKKIIVSAIVAIIVTLTILVVIYFATDLFKTEQQLFYKYIAQTKVVNSNFATQYNVANEKTTKNSNSSNMNIDFERLLQNQETGGTENQKILSINSNGLKNSLTEQSYRDFTFSSNEQNFLTLKYIKDVNTHALFADNIVAKYLAVENSNLKDFFTKLGVEDTTGIPNSIPTNYDEILKIDEATLLQLKETYGTLIYNNINEENFYKIKNSDKTETIGVSLTNRDIINLIKVTLETIKNDTTLLNLIATKTQLLNYNTLNITDMQSEIQELINEIAAEEIAEEQEILKIGLVKKDKTITKLIIDMYQVGSTSEEIVDTYDVQPINPIAEIVKQNIVIDFSEANKIILSIKENDNEIANTILNYSYDNNNINLNMEVQLIENEEANVIKIQYQINNYQTDNIIQNLVVNMNSGAEENYQIKMVNNITLKQDVQISKLTTENSAKLNNMTSDELQQLFVALGNRINQVYGESLTNLYSNNSIINHAQDAQKKYEEAAKREEEALKKFENDLKNEIESYQ